MAAGKDAQEPSMEEILTSIRRIIADEQDEPSGKPAAPVAAAPAEPPAAEEGEEDELELTELVPETPPAEAAAPPTPRRIQPQERSSMPLQDPSSLVSPATAEASTNALSRLTRMVASEDKASPGGGRTIEELVIELLRPQLKDWLDQNLVPLVERVVEQEVKKLARRAELL